MVLGASLFGALGCYCYYSLRQEEETTLFFNRVEERRILHDRFKAPRKYLTVLMGPPSVGKSALVNEVLKDFPNSAYLDLRLLNNVSVGSLEELFNQSVDTWKYKMALNLSGVLPSKLVKWKIQAEMEKPGVAGDQIPAEAKFMRAVKSTLNEFHKWSFIDQRPAVLVIDEANRLKDLYEIDEKFVADFLSLLVDFSKQRNQVSIVLATSDSFFIEWLSQVGGVVDHVRPTTLGDLPKEEAKKFFMNQQKDQQQHLSKTFDEVYNALGGRMFSIQQYVAEPQQHFDDLPHVSMFYERLSNLSNPSKIPRLGGNRSADKPRWSEKEFADVVRAVVDSPRHAVPSAQFKDIVSPECLSDLVKFNILCYRPNQSLARDLVGLEHPIYTFPFPEDVIAARKFLNKL